jgi:alpha-L-fucosidase
MGHSAGGGFARLLLERGRMLAKTTPYPWLNDDSIDWKSWCYIEDPHYKSADRLVDGLVDIVSKNGNLARSSNPRPDGTIPEPTGSVCWRSGSG